MNTRILGDFTNIYSREGSTSVLCKMWTDLVNSQLLHQNGLADCPRMFRLVSHHQDRSSLSIQTLQQTPQLGPGLLHPGGVGGVHHEDDPVRIEAVVPPDPPDLTMSAHVLDTELHPTN